MTRPRWLNRTLSLFLMALVLCFTILFFTQHWLHKAMIAEKEEQAMANLRLVDASMDAAFDQVQKLSQLLLMDLSIARFIYQDALPSGSMEIQTIIDAISLLPISTSINSLVPEIYVYSDRSGYILSSRNAFLDPERMYPTLFAFEGLNYRQFKNTYLTSQFQSRFFPLTEALIQGRPRTVVPYAQTFPLTNPSANAGKILFLIDGTFLSQLLASQERIDGFSTFIIDRKGEVIASAGNLDVPIDPTFADGQHRVSIEGSEYILSIASSTVTDLRFFTFLSTDEVLAMLDPLWLVASLVALVVFLLFALVSFLALHRSNRRWNELLGLAGKTLPYEEAVGYISSIVEKDRARTREAGFTPFITDTFFRRLIHGRMSDPSEIRIMLDHIREDIDPDPPSVYQMLNVSILDARELSSSKQYKDVDFTRIVASRQARAVFGPNHYIYMDLAFTIWILVWHTQGRHLDDRIDLFWREFSSAVPTTTALSVSSQRIGPEHIFALAGECSEIRHSFGSGKSGGTMLRYQELRVDPRPYSFGRNEERLLIQGILKGDHQALNELLEEIERVNIIERNLSPQEHGNLLKVLYASAITVSRLLNLPLYRNPFKSFEEAKNFFLAQARQVKRTRQDADELLVRNIEHYIAEMYSDPTLNLSHMADHFGLKESYLYHFMLTRMGSSFAQYVESYRLDRSLSLFRNQELTIAQIARSSGYANPQTFRRAFSKRFGLLPSDHQKLVLTTKG
ncbi:MAG: helix-turn-helix transcriptional regulator [Spirochaetales bacterium]|nr:helix-turn-helix transcriptional regulator [Spirochaetales bacterium]